jgi:prolyl-tRNA synthetase
MFLAAKKLLDEKTYVATDYDDFKRIMAEIPGLIKAMWRGDESCEDVIKEQTSATSRCAPFQQERLSDVCVCGGGKAKKMIVWSKAY